MSNAASEILASVAILNLTVYSTQLMEIEESSSRPVREHLKKGGGYRDLIQRLSLATNGTIHTFIESTCFNMFSCRYVVRRLV